MESRNGRRIERETKGISGTDNGEECNTGKNEPITIYRQKAPDFSRGDEMKHLGWTKERPKEECVFAVCCIRENCEGKIVRDYDIWRIENYESE